MKKKKPKQITCPDCGVVYDNHEYDDCPSSGCTEARLEEQTRLDFEDEQSLQSFEEGFEENP